MGKNYQHHQIGIQEIVQLNSNKHGFRSSCSLLFYKEAFLKFCKIHMKTPETCSSNKKKLHCLCFPMNFAKLLRILFYRTPPDDYFLHSLCCFFATWLTNRNQVFFYFWTCFITAFECDEYHELWIHFTLQYSQPSCCCRESFCCRHFSETPAINLHSISVLHCPVILYLKVIETAVDVTHLFRGVL